MISVVAFFTSMIVITLLLNPDPYLLSIENHTAAEKPKKVPAKVAIAHIRQNPMALFAMIAVAIGHVVMVSIMVMTPVQMSHVDVTLKVIGLVISVHVIGMYAFSPLVGSLSDKIGKLRTIQIGLLILFASAIVSAHAHANDITQMAIGLFLLGLGWSFTLVAGSTLLSTSVDPSMKTGAQGTSDLFMNMSAAVGGALAGVIIANLSYAWLCAIAMIPVALVALWSFRFKR
jgi:MFS family permease